MKKSLYCLSLMTVLFLAAIAQAVPVQNQLLFHYRADFLTYADGAEVTSWSDACSTAPNATLATKSGYGTPNFVANGWNGLPAVSFERHIGTDNTVKTFLESGAYDFPTGTSGSLLTIFMVAQHGFAGFTNRTFHIGEKNNNANNCFEVDLGPTADGTGNTGEGGRSNGGRVCAYTSFTPGEWHISSRRVQEGQSLSTMQLRVNNVLVSTYGAGTMDFLDTSSSRNINLMGFGVNSTFGVNDNEAYEGDIAEVLVYNYLSDENVTAVYNFLNNKYNNLMAHNPTPAKQSTDQGEDIVMHEGQYRTKLKLGWDTGHVAAGSETFNPAIQYHYVYIEESEPNLYAATTPKARITAGSNSAITDYVYLEPGTKHYWRVDEVWAQVGTEPNCITGDVWTLTPMNTKPRITVTGGNSEVFPGETAMLSHTFFTPSAFPVTLYQWFRSPLNDKTYTDDGDPVFESTTESRLIYNPAQVAHEGFYYQRIHNSQGYVESSMRMIGIKREMGRWTMNSADYVSGQFLDSSTADTTDYDATSNVADNAQFVTGKFAGLGQGYNFVPSPQAAAKTAAFWPTPYTDHLTVSAWLKWNGATGAIQGAVCNMGPAVDPSPSDDSFWLQIRSADAFLELDIDGTGRVVMTDLLPINQWVHVVATCGPAGLKIYINGVLAEANDTRTSVPRISAPIYIGARDSDGTGMLSPFNGAIDDVRIYNYEMDLFGAVDLYSEMSGEIFCVNKDNLEMRFDKNNDCFVDMADFAEFANDWLACGIYPQGCE